MRRCRCLLAARCRAHAASCSAADQTGRSAGPLSPSAAGGGLLALSCAAPLVAPSLLLEGGGPPAEASAG